MTAKSLEDLDAKTANVVYHDWEASNYDDRWGISFDDRCTQYAREKFGKVAPLERYGDVLEIGCGTGFFIVNLWQAGLIERGCATDISPGMVEVCRRNAEAAGMTYFEGKASDAEALPYDDNSFDLVVGHAVLHHLPDVPAALRECLRVLRPGGRLVIAGEPTRIGYRIALAARRNTARVYKALARFAPGWLREEGNGDHPPEAALEAHVDLHEFHPHMVWGWLRDAGFDTIDVQTEELLSGIFGWSARTIEALAPAEKLGQAWPFLAYHGYMNLYRFDHRVMRHLVPKPLFYNLLFGATKPVREIS